MGEERFEKLERLEKPKMHLGESLVLDEGRTPIVFDDASLKVDPTSMGPEERVDIGQLGKNVGCVLN